MPRKPKKLKRPTWLEVWKGTRKEPVPASRTHQPKDREIDEGLADDEMRQWQSWRGESYEDFEE